MRVTRMYAKMKTWGATEFDGKILRWYPGDILPFEAVSHLNPSLYELIIEAEPIHPPESQSPEPEPQNRLNRPPRKRGRPKNTMIKPDDLETS
jgi:hypothetical protein